MLTLWLISYACPCVTLYWRERPVFDNVAFILELNSDLIWFVFYFILVFQSGLNWNKMKQMHETYLVYYPAHTSWDCEDLFTLNQVFTIKIDGVIHVSSICKHVWCSFFCSLFRAIVDMFMYYVCIMYIIYVIEYIMKA